jgi:hypothetical protein
MKSEVCNHDSVKNVSSHRLNDHIVFIQVTCILCGMIRYETKDLKTGSVTTSIWSKK